MDTKKKRLRDIFRKKEENEGKLRSQKRNNFIFKRLFGNFQNDIQTWIKTTLRPGIKVKELKYKDRTPLGEKKANVVYSTPCKCKNNIYIGETYIMFETSKKNKKLKSVKKDPEEGNMKSEETRMDNEDGGIASHSTQGSQGVDWKKLKVVVTRKKHQAQESQRGHRIGETEIQWEKPRNHYDHPDDWKLVVLKYVGLEPLQKIKMKNLFNKS